jgi:Bifunctional DNA primase/polymerase, N-terminal/Primase C terminal 1 (PriCT-1)
VTFRDWQAEYAAFGIATFPVSIEPGRKKPMVSNYARFGTRASAGVAKLFPDATGIGFMAGSCSRITALDVDTPDQAVLRKGLDRHGQSPIIVRSGSGNHQVWYRWNGEQRRIRPFSEHPIDILGGGVVVAPPSRGIKADYEFIQGSLADLAHLQPISGLPEEAYSHALHATLKKNERSVTPGTRNNTLFRECMKAARSCDDFDQLLDFTRTRNAEYLPPLPDNEAVKVARSAWGYEERGQNLIGSGGKIVLLSHRDVDLLAKDHTDALALLAILRREHWGRKIFILSKKMAEFLGWDLRRLKAARDRLVECGQIRCLHPGGRGPHDPPKYQLV